MSYRVLYQRHAKTELTLCCETYPNLKHPLLDWIKDLAEESESRREILSQDISHLPPYLSREFDPFQSSWEYTWSQLKRQSWSKDFQAILDIIISRQPPWELRVGWRFFEFLDRQTYMVLVFFDIDHIEKKIIIRMFDGLPGQ